MTGKCPKCKATFRVPQPESVDAPPSESPISDSGVSEPELADSPSGSGRFIASSDSGTIPNPAELAADSDAAPHADDPAADGESADAESTGAPQTETAQQPGAEERIVFLCPNGHKLNCPASMQGAPANVRTAERRSSCRSTKPRTICPPRMSWGWARTRRPRTKRSSRLPNTSSEAPEIEGFNGQTYESDPFTFDFTSLTADSPAGGPQTGNPMAGVFQRLWLHKRTGGIVELYLKGGEVIAPEWFSPRQSQETYGMFAFAERDGSFTMTAVHWDSIERIAVRNVEALPQGMFDEES